MFYLAASHCARSLESIMCRHIEQLTACRHVKLPTRPGSTQHRGVRTVSKACTLTRQLDF